jgi:hypothetical protein
MLGGYSPIIIFFLAIILIILYLLGTRDDIKRARKVLTPATTQESTAIVEDVTETCKADEVQGDVSHQVEREDLDEESIQEVLTCKSEVGDVIDLTPEIPLDEDDQAIKAQYQQGGGRWKTESYCREILEELFNANFPTKRPNWLINPNTGRRLELDCYNEKLKLALEYNGEQHYNFPNRYNQADLDAFIDGVGRDFDKRSICKDNGVYLIIVPYHIRKPAIKRYIYRELHNYLPIYEEITGDTLKLDPL